MILPLLLAAITLTPTLAPATPTSTSEIQKIRQVIQEKVKEKLAEINQGDTDPKRAFVGTITQIEGSLIHLDTPQAIRLLTTDANTVCIGSKQIKIKLSDLKIGQEILAIGLLNDLGELQAKRLVVSTLKNIQNPKTIVYGQIVDISQSSPILVLIPTNDKNIQYQLKYTDAKTVFINKNGIKIKFDTIKIGQKVAVVATPETKNPKNLLVEKLILM